MANIHDVIKDEEANGQIVGRFLSVGYLAYDGRMQRQKIYADSEEELRLKAEGVLASIKSDCGQAFNDIFPKDDWRLIVLQ